MKTIITIQDNTGVKRDIVVSGKVSDVSKFMRENYPHAWYLQYRYEESK